ncbi:hypothetical protein THMIRHAS_07540 [Thiosulfatimonas sediminis]|uniref:Response receiver domain-containing protein n=2 Tax=Thiosulfatimonas sediminis TaxID=2675054 RepID=A0A6F8PTC5_9GAMM|nr:hypothetical protein THMIRHAS_07540 [Thiosulfatimonas sediminis]
MMTPFETTSREIALNFLQTVLIIDDEIEESPHETKLAPPPQPEEIKAPIGRGLPASSQKAKINAQDKKPEESKDDSSEIAHTISPKISALFANEGILCSMLKPEKSDQYFEKRTQKALRKADITILDWKMAKEGANNDARVKSIIESIVGNEESHKQKALRFIVIYSGEHKLLDEHIHSTKTWVDDLTSEVGKIEGEHDHQLSYNHLKFCFYAKPNEHNTEISHIHRKEDELVNSVINDFAKTIQGITPNLTLHSITSIRENTHRLLQKFSHEIDGGYLAHRIMLPNPEEAEEQFIDLFAHELKSILDDSKIELSDEAIKNWAQHRLDHLDEAKQLQLYRDTFFSNFSYTNSDSAISTLSPCLTKPEIEGISKVEDKKLLFTTDGKVEELIETKKADLKKKYIDHVIPSLPNNLFKLKIAKCLKVHIDKTNPSYLTNLLPCETTDSNDQFGLLTTTRTFYSSPTPTLNLGSIIKHNEQYYLCISPRCDTARVKAGEGKETAFQLLPLKPSEKDVYDVIVKQPEAEIIKLKIIYTPTKLKSIIFPQTQADNNKPIRANQDEKFIDINKMEYQWIGELKADKAQQVLNQFAAQLSRVGINESEVLRRAYQAR